jgi:hypothetical protein
MTNKRSFDVDVIVFATGFDAMTKARSWPFTDPLAAGKNCPTSLGQRPRTYLGLTVAGFPNLFMVTGPGSPSVLSNMVIVDRTARPTGSIEAPDCVREAGSPLSSRPSAGRLDATYGRLFDGYAAQGQHTVHGRQRPRQDTGVMPIPAVSALPRHLQRGRQRGMSASRSLDLMFKGSAATARSFACSDVRRC